MRHGHRMRNRLMLAFAGFTLLVAAVFALYAVLLVYVVEDRFFERMLEREAAAQLQHFAEHGRWSTPADASTRVYPSHAALPEQLRGVLAQGQTRAEMAGGAGRHYHLRKLDSPAGTAPAYVVAEVGEQLVVRPMRDHFFTQLAWSILVMVMLALLIAYWLAGRAVAPLAQLAAQVEAMQPERLQAFAEQYRDHEVVVVARGLDTLVARVQGLLAREREFSRDAGHELRTPLAVIRSACERLLTQPELSLPARQQVEFLRQSARQLEQAVAALLALARDDEPRSAVAGPILPALESVIVEQSLWLQGKAVDVQVNVPRDACLRLPESVLRILLGNLIGNAFAHTTAGSVHVGVEGERLFIANAAGLPDQVRDTLFQPFSRGDASAGHGLGLSIVRRLCDRYGVDLRIETTAETTTVSIALEPAAAAR